MQINFKYLRQISNIYTLFHELKNCSENSKVYTSINYNSQEYWFIYFQQTCFIKITFVRPVFDIKMVTNNNKVSIAWIQLYILYFYLIYYTKYVKNL